jgi:hypothetical protein
MGFVEFLIEEIRVAPIGTKLFSIFVKYCSEILLHDVAKEAEVIDIKSNTKYTEISRMTDNSAHIGKGFVIKSQFAEA